MKQLNRKHIDNERWNDCVLQSPIFRHYPLTYFLDACCQDWSGIIGEDYSWVWPIPIKRRLVQRVYQPLLAQQLGPFGRRLSPKEINEVLSHLQGRYWGYNIKYNEGVSDLPFKSTTRHRNVELDLQDDVETIRRRYNRNAISNIKKANRSNVDVHRVKEFQSDLLDMFISSRGKHLDQLDDKFYLDVRSIYNSFLERQEAETWLIKNQFGSTIAGVMLLITNGRILNFFTASGSEARVVGGMHRIIDAIILEYAGRAKTLDFEGSNDDNLAYFYKSFGGVERVYLQSYKRWNIPSLNR